MNDLVIYVYLRIGIGRLDHTNLLFYSFSTASPSWVTQKVFSEKRKSVTNIPPFWFSAKAYLFKGNISKYVHPINGKVLF